MSVKTLASLCVAAALALAVAVPAAAQTEDIASASALHVSVPSFVADSSASAEAAPAFDMSFGEEQRPTTHTMGGRQVFVRAQAGLITGVGDTGFFVGVGVSGQPRSTRNVEIAGDFNFGRIAGENFLYFSVDGIYDFHMKGHDTMPYAGGGLVVAHSTGNTDTNLQILAGIQLPVTGPHVVRFEVRFLFTEGSPVLLLGSFSF